MDVVQMKKKKQLETKYSTQKNPKISMFLCHSYVHIDPFNLSNYLLITSMTNRLSLKHNYIKTIKFHLLLYWSKLLTSHFYTDEWTVALLEACSCSKNDRDIIYLLSHWYKLYYLLVRSVIFRIRSTSGQIIGQICRQFLFAFSVNS